LTQDEIIAMLRAACDKDKVDPEQNGFWVIHTPELEAFAKLVAQRTWVGLTDEEQLELYKEHCMDGWGLFYNAIEAKLKEKNITPYCGHEETIVKGSLVHCKKCNHCFGVD